MDFEAIKQALVTMSTAMVGVLNKLEEQVEIEKQMLEELKTLNDSR